MATFRASEADNYGGTGGTGFFGIANDMEVKKVRFMYNTIEDVQGTSVHQVEVNGKRRYVDCLRTYNEPLDTCPFCASKLYPTQARLFIPVYNVEEKQVQIWDRGKTMFQKISGICAKYSSPDKPLVSNIFEIERHGKPKDTKTDYVIYYLDKDDTQLTDLPEVLDFTNNLVLEKTAEEMEVYLSTGSFPDSKNADDVADEMPIRRRSAERRTPANREAF